MDVIHFLGNNEAGKITRGKSRVTAAVCLHCVYKMRAETEDNCPLGSPSVSHVGDRTASGPFLQGALPDSADYGGPLRSHPHSSPYYFFPTVIANECLMMVSPLHFETHKAVPVAPYR